MSTHALLSPSAAGRWTSCPPSARLEDLFPDDTTEAAEEGTQAHAIAELKIKELLYGEDTAKKQEALHNGFYTHEMEECTDAYAEYIANEVERMQGADPNTEITAGIEARCDLSSVVPDCFGTVDCMLITGQEVHVIDLKYGKGVKVEALNNKQLALYAYGGYLAAKQKGLRPEVVGATIFQPRIGNVQTMYYTPEELADLIQGISRAAEEAYRGAGEQQAGDHCRFCRARVICRTRYDHFLALSDMAEEQREAYTMTDEQITDVLRRGDEIAKWIDSVKDYALKQAVEAGQKWSGYKLVAGRSIRKIADADKALGLLLSSGYASEDVQEKPKLKNLTALEKLVGKAELARVLAEVIVKPEGAPTLVPADDKRDEILTDAAEVFKAHAREAANK